MTDQPQSRLHINTNTGVSVGIIFLLFGWGFMIMNAINSTKTDVGSTRNEIAAVKMELNGKIDKIDAKVIAIEGSKSGVTATEFFRWAVHLQQANSDPKRLQSEGLKVPEPEITK
jgi:hypothetical protein